MVVYIHTVYPDSAMELTLPCLNPTLELQLIRQTLSTLDQKIKLMGEQLIRKTSSLLNMPITYYFGFRIMDIVLTDGCFAPYPALLIGRGHHRKKEQRVRTGMGTISEAHDNSLE
jgi:hypothetical protein